LNIPPEKESTLDIDFFIDWDVIPEKESVADRFWVNNAAPFEKTTLGPLWYGDQKGLLKMPGIC